MKNRPISFLLLLFAALACRSQEGCEAGFRQDTLLLPGQKRSIAVEYLQTTLKNRSVVRLYRAAGNKYYLKLIVTENLYFDKTDKLEVQSGGMSYTEPKIVQYELDKSTGYYVFEIFKNYVATLKDEGITAIVFGTAKTDFSRQDTRKIRDISKCLYDIISVKK